MNDQSWASELVANWCSAEASELRLKASRIRRRYANGPLIELAAEFANMLDRHASGFQEKERQLLGAKNENTK